MSTAGELPAPGGRIDDTRAFKPVRIAVLTVSDTRGVEEDTSGKILCDRIAQAGHVLAGRALVRDDKTEIAGQVQAWIDAPDVDAVITTGGTGLTGRDVTPDHAAVRQAYRGLCRNLASRQLSERRPVDPSVTCLCRGNKRDVHILPAGL